VTVSGIDIAWARPTVAQIKASGAHWVARYFSKDSSKNLHASEVTSYKAAGLGIVVVWETTAGRALAGHAAGVADAQAAEAQRKAVGMPADMPLHFAVDTDTDWPHVAAYFAGAVSVLGLHRVGVYGGFEVIEGAAAAGHKYLWQTVAWSGGHWSTHATIRQTGKTTLAGGADQDAAMTTDFGQYPRPSAPHKPPAPKPGSKPHVSLSHLIAAAKADPKAKQGHTTHPTDVRIVEAALKAEGYLPSKYAGDGSFGSTTVLAYAAYQRHLGYVGAAADGIPGKTSLTKLGQKHGFTVGS
jgi:hypothetical protein